MADLIDRATIRWTLVDGMVQCLRNNSITKQRMAQLVLNRVDAAPTVDTEPVKRGRWERYHKVGFGRDEYGVKCSACDLEVENGKFPYHSNYCPSCGARMEENNG